MILTQKEVNVLDTELDRMAQKLQELGCTSVALFTTFPVKCGMTGSRVSRRGDYWAQRGMVQGWLETQQAGELVDQLSNVFTDEEES